MNVVELRRYALKPGRREDLIALFEREFVAGQEACGITLLGYYRDLDDPDAFVWLRGFDTMEQRREALHAFYVCSETWARNRDAANDTMLDSDNVLLLRPATTQTPRDGRSLLPDSFVAISIAMLAAPADDAYVDRFQRTMRPPLEAIAADVRCFVTEPHPNTFPRLPVREGEWAFVVTGKCADRQAIEEWRRILVGTQTLRLEPIGTSCRR
jgi:hypothetical protein